MSVGKGYRIFFILLAIVIIASLSLSADDDIDIPRNNIHFYYVIRYPQPEFISFRFIDMSESKNEIDELVIESPDTLDSGLYRLQVLSNYRENCEMEFTFRAFYNEAASDYLGYDLRIFNNKSGSEKIDDSYEIPASGSFSQEYEIEDRYGPSSCDDDDGEVHEYLYCFGYRFKDLDQAEKGRYASIVNLEISGL